MRIFILSLLLVAELDSACQKKILTNEVINKWPSIENVKINSKGNYVLYNYSQVESASGPIIVIQSIDHKWEKEIINCNEARFTRNGNSVVYRTRSDSLFVDILGSYAHQFYGQVKSYELILAGKNELLITRIANADKELRIFNLSTGDQKSFSDVEYFKLNENGQALILEKEENRNGISYQVLQWVNLCTTEIKTIWESAIHNNSKFSIGNFQWDREGAQMVFMTFAANVDQENSLWYFDYGGTKARKLINSKTKGMPVNSFIAQGRFNKKGNSLFVEISQPSNILSTKTLVAVDLWSYRDDKLQVQQLNEATNSLDYVGGFNLKGDSVIILSGPGERLYENKHGSDDYSILTSTPCLPEENFWKSNCRTPLFLLNNQSGHRQLISENLIVNHINSLSPSERYAIYCDLEAQAFFSYDIITGKRINITKDFPVSLFNLKDARAGLPLSYGGISNWLSGEGGLLINDEFDIWKVDPAGIQSPICLTNGYGRRNGIIFRLAKGDRIITEDKPLLIAFRSKDKANGFFKLNLENKADPELLTIGPYLYYWPYITGVPPIKAKNANRWLVSRMTGSRSPNYFVTKDFKTFKPITDFFPEKEYNWLTSELVEWKDLSGNTYQGILYKPENFDSTKKYPVIFNFYEERSDELHQYLIPEATSSKINIPYFVSNGYLIFVPDIKYKNGVVSESVTQSILSSVRYLSTLSWIDSSRVGVQGHSFAGYEVNILISKTNLFAAAAEAAGVSDLVSGYGSIGLNGESFQSKYETGQYRIGTTLWQNSSSFIKNSPIFEADKVGTPLLMMHCKQDGSVPFEQAVEWFTALRRLNKRVWMLQYDRGNHQLSGKEAKDYTIRLKQFFDHYLKDAPARIWQTKGISARLKGVITGYDLDPTGDCGKSCKVCKMWNDKMAKDSIGTMQEIERRKKEEHWQ